MWIMGFLTTSCSAEGQGQHVFLIPWGKIVMSARDAQTDILKSIYLLYFDSFLRNFMHKYCIYIIYTIPCSSNTSLFLSSTLVLCADRCVEVREPFSRVLSFLHGICDRTLILRLAQEAFFNPLNYVARPCLAFLIENQPRFLQKCIFLLGTSTASFVLIKNLYLLECKISIL